MPLLLRDEFDERADVDDNLITSDYIDTINAELAADPEYALWCLELEMNNEQRDE